MALDEFNLCEICDDRVDEARLAVGLKTCWRCIRADPKSPPWDMGATVQMGYDPGVDIP